MSWLYWNPSREIFVIPVLNFPVVWYGMFFALGFFIGYYIFFYLLRRYFLNFYLFKEEDVKNWDLLICKIKNPGFSEKIVTNILKIQDFEKKNIIKAFNTLFSKNFDVKKILGTSQKASIRIFIENSFENCFFTTKQKCFNITEKVTLYIVFATIIGARLGHILFYEKWAYYLNNPLKIFKLWEGGLASHGAAVFIILALLVLSYKYKKYGLCFIRFLDFIAVPTCFAAVFIRIGNFFNQEILGKPTKAFYGVIFGSPLDGSLSVPRHPVQLYEAFFYLMLFCVLFFLSFKPSFYLKKGKLIGVFLFFTFVFRFFIEFLKEKQSFLLPNDTLLLMGQYLSLPFICLGILFFFWQELMVLVKRDNLYNL